MNITKNAILFLIFLSFSIPIFSQTNTENWDMSDEDRRMMNNYNSDNYNQQVMDELCGTNTLKDKDASDETKKNVGKLTGACRGESVKTFGMDESSIAIISKAYSQFSMMMSGGSLIGNATETSTDVASAGADAAVDTSKKAGEKAGEQASKGKNKKKIDFCGMIGAGTEMVGAFNQDQYQKHLSQIPMKAENVQTESLMKIQQQYREKAKNQELNSVGWAGTAVCYVGRMATGGIDVDGGTILKTIAAGAIGVFNGFSAKNHRAMADELNVVIQNMPKNGDCNPITETHCFCSLPENLNNEKYCMPEIRARAFKQYGTQVSCLDANGNPDGSCSCIARNNCFDVTYMQSLDGISFGKSFDEANAKAMRQIARGTIGKSSNLGNGDLSNNAIKKIKNALQRVADKEMPNNRPLNSDEKKQALYLHGLGIPKSMAAALAKTPSPNSRMLARVRTNFVPSDNNYNWKSNRKSKSKVQGFNNASNFSIGNNSNSGGRRNSNRDFQALIKGKGKTGSSGNGGKVLNFAEKARAQASISTRKDVSIFQIISRRYQISSEERLK